MLNWTYVNECWQNSNQRAYRTFRNTWLDTKNEDNTYNEHNKVFFFFANVIQVSTFISLEILSLKIYSRLMQINQIDYIVESKCTYNRYFVDNSAIKR